MVILAWTEALLAESTTAARWWQVLLDNALALTVLVIFLTAIIAALAGAWQRDKCLKLMDDYHVTYLTTAGTPAWGDLVVYSRGIELRFDAPYRTRLGTTKSSSLIYEEELDRCLAICRISSALAEDERGDRARQVTRTFTPGLLRRTLRLMRNLVNTLRDACGKSFSAILGQVSKAKPTLAGGKGEMEALGKTLLGSVANAYEPMLERHIGRPVILRLEHPAPEKHPPIELPGYLVDYTNKYLAVFNVQHTPRESLDLEITGPVQQPGLSVSATQDGITIDATGPEALVVRRATVGGREYMRDVVLLPGCRINLTCQKNQPVRLKVERTLEFDIVCPRSIAKVHYGSDMPAAADAEPDRRGLAPREVVDEDEGA